MTSAALTAPRTAPRPRIGAWLATQAPAVIALIVFAAALWPAAMLNDSDTWWHLSAGDWILAHRAVPHTDLFSWSFAGKPWIAHEWLSEVIMSGAYMIGGWPGLMLLTAAAAGLSVYLLARQAARHMTGLSLGLLVLGGAALFAPHFLARPHMLVAPVMIAWFAGLTNHKGTPPWRLLPLMTLWANMHGSFIAGIALTAPLAIEAVLAASDRPRTAGLWLGFIAIAVVAALLTPFGLDGLLFPLRLLTMADLNGIGEWRPVDLTHPQPLLLAIVAVAALWLMRRPRLSVVRRVALVALLAMSLHQQRQEMLLGVLGVLWLAEPFGKALGQTPIPIKTSPVFVAAAALLAALRLATPIADPVNDQDPAAAIAHAPAGRVLNDYAFGGYLIRAHIAPFIDSRADLYGPAFLDRYSRIVNTPAALKAELRTGAIAWTMFAPGSVAAGTMDHLAGWRRTYADAIAVIHVRDSAPNATAGAR